MKKYLSIAYLVILILISFNTQAYRPLSFSKPSLTPKIDAEEMIKDIIAVIGLKPNFDVKAANIPNAAAVTYSGKRYIAYNPVFIANLNAKAGNKWASVSILAHEIGHHLNGHTLLRAGNPALELEADEFSGFVLKKMGATLSQAQVAMKLAADYKPSLTHPGQQDRLLAIARGWNKASGTPADMAKYSAPAPQMPAAKTYDRPSMTKSGTEQNKIVARKRIPSDVRTGKALLDPRYILAYVNFPSDRTANYYVTTQYDLVKVINNQLFVLGKMLATNSAKYPFVMKNQRGTLFVDKNGKILTPNNEVAGYLTKA